MANKKQNIRKGTGTLCETGIADLGFLKEGRINIVKLFENQISIKLDSGAQITTYYKFVYRENEDTIPNVIDAESEKLSTPYSRILGKSIMKTIFSSQNSLIIEISDGSSIEFLISNDGYECFLINSPSNQTYIFS